MRAIYLLQNRKFFCWMEDIVPLMPHPCIVCHTFSNSFLFSKYIIFFWSSLLPRHTISHHFFYHFTQQHINNSPDQTTKHFKMRFELSALHVKLDFHRNSNCTLRPTHLTLSFSIYFSFSLSHFHYVHLLLLLVFHLTICELLLS